MRLRQLEAFRQVMLTGSLTRAASVLGISQPGVSRLLSELERRVGFRLFERRGGRVHPTKESVQFLRHVERSFVGVEALQVAAADIANARGAALRIAAFPSVSLKLLPASVSAFNREHPDTRIALTVTNSSRVCELVSMLQVDIGITTLPPPHGGLEPRFKVVRPCVCVLSANHALVRSRTVRAADLRKERLIFLDPSFATTQGLETILQEAGIHPTRVADTSFAYSACEMVRLGAGVAIVDPLTALAFESREIVFRRFSPSVNFAFGIVLPAYGLPSLACERFEKILTAGIEAMEVPR